MAYESLSQIFAEMDEIHARFYERVGQLSAEDLSARPEAGGWSVGEIVEHVSLVEQSILKLINLLLMKAEAAGVAANADGSIGPLSAETIIERSQREKYSAPDSALPSGNVSATDAFARMRAVRDALEELRPRLAQTNLLQVSYPHPAFGPMNSYEWLILIGIHEDRHLRQIEAIISEPVGQ